MNEDISHYEIYQRLIEVEAKVDLLHKETRAMVETFKAVEGAFTVLGWIAKAAKPLLWIGGVVAAISIMYAELKIGK